MHPLSPDVVRTALEDAPDAMLIVDTAGTIVTNRFIVEREFKEAPCWTSAS
jgi:hypothetical protein